MAKGRAIRKIEFFIHLSIIVLAFVLHCAYQLCTLITAERYTQSCIHQDFSNDYSYQLEKRSESEIVSVVNLAVCSSLSSLSQERLISAKRKDHSVAILSLASALKDCVTAVRSLSAAVEV